MQKSLSFWPFLSVEGGAGRDSAKIKKSSLLAKYLIYGYNLQYF